jgi:hypothetical protein
MVPPAWPAFEFLFTCRLRFAFTFHPEPVHRSVYLGADPGLRVAAS